MLEFSKNISSKSQNIVKENIGFLKIFYLLKWKFQNSLIIYRCVKMAKVLKYKTWVVMGVNPQKDF